MRVEKFAKNFKYVCLRIKNSIINDNQNLIFVLAPGLLAGSRRVRALMRLILLALNGRISYPNEARTPGFNEAVA